MMEKNKEHQLLALLYKLEELIYELEVHNESDIDLKKLDIIIDKLQLFLQKKEI
jgi:hypothetical protein